MPTIVEICNAALGKLGQDVRIASLQEANKTARAFNASYDRIRDYVLADAVWPFATKTAALALRATTSPGWAYLYAYPSDCLSAIAISGADGVRAFRNSYLNGIEVNGANFDIVYDVGGQSIVTEEIGAYLLYSCRVEEASRYSPLFAEALACRLAIENAPVIAAEIGLRMLPLLEQKYAATRDRAVVSALNESSDRNERVSMTLAARG